MYIDLHVKYQLFSSECYKTLIFSTDFQKNSNTKLYENLSSGNRVAPCGRTEGQI